MIQRIRTNIDPGSTMQGRLGGYLDGKQTYLWIGEGNRCIGVLSKRTLYRLAKAIVKQFDQAKVTK